jgi:enamine deaminase RidA (YjgF/YER057c/UK114 family)
MKRIGTCEKQDIGFIKPGIQRFDAGPRMSEIVVHSNGTVYLAGQVATDASADIKVQTAQVLALIDSLLERVGSEKSKLMMVQIFLADLSDFDQMNEVWDAWVVPGSAPARATVEAKLANPDWKIEVVATACI